MIAHENPFAKSEITGRVGSSDDRGRSPLTQDRCGTGGGGPRGRYRLMERRFGYHRERSIGNRGCSHHRRSSGGRDG